MCRSSCCVSGEAGEAVTIATPCPVTAITCCSRSSPASCSHLTFPRDWRRDASTTSVRTGNGFRGRFEMLFCSHLTPQCVFSVPRPGHSHQLFHVCAVVGTHFQLEAVLADMTSRRGWLTAHSAAPSFLGTLGALALGLLLNLGVITLFSASLMRASNLSPEKGGPTNCTPPPSIAAVTTANTVNTFTTTAAAKKDE